jgi:hypothetical protein
MVLGLARFHLVAQSGSVFSFAAPPASLFSGYCYKYIGTSQLWSQHEVQCSQATYNGAPWGGGHLATMFDQNSATVVMDNKCNGLATNAQYFIGYYICCGSTAYSSRTDWRWSSTISTTWIHGQSKYLSGAEPDDLGCGRAHGGDDGATPGKIADWYCTSNAVGACCEAPAIPSPSATVTSTRTATSTETATHTRSAVSCLKICSRDNLHCQAALPTSHITLVFPLNFVFARADGYGYANGDGNSDQDRNVNANCHSNYI